MSFEKLIEEIGLAHNESIVYTTLLQIGKSKAAKIVQESKVSSGKIYETLNKLIDKGLVKIIEENNIKHFIASPAETLLLYLEEKEKRIESQKEEIKKIIPKLNQLSKPQKETVSMIKGLKGIRSLVFSLLPCKETVLVMGVRSGKNQTYNLFWKSWHSLRIESKIDCKILFSDKNTDYFNHFKNLPFTKVKVNEGFTPAAITIIDDNVLTFSYEPEIVCIHIKSEQIAKSYKEFFKSLWE